MSSILPELTDDDLLDQQRRIHPPHQVATWDGTPEGAAVYGAIAEVFASVAGSVARSGEARLIMEATGPQRSTCTAKVTFADAIASGRDVAINAGQVIAQTPWGEKFRLAAGFAVTSPQSAGYQVTVSLESVWANGDTNVAAGDISRWALPDGVDPAGDIDFDLAASDLLGVGAFIVGVGDGSITIAGFTDATGGRDGTLDLIGAGRGVPRVEGETDAAARVRMRSLPDTVTPAAMLRIANRALAPYGLTATFAESHEFAWVVGHATRGVIGSYPTSRRAHFVITVPTLPVDHPGWVVGQVTRGAIGRRPFGTFDTAAAGFISGLQSSIDGAKLGGVWGRVAGGI